MQKLISTKSAVYCVDTLNLIRRGDDGPLFPDENSAISALLELVQDALDGALRDCEFRLFVDGAGGNFPFRPPKGVLFRFSGSESADDLILDTACYLKASGRRVVVVSSDGGVLALARAEGVKCLSCDSFLALCRKASSSL